MRGDNGGREQDGLPFVAMPGQHFPQAPPGLQCGNDDERVMEINGDALFLSLEQPAADLLHDRPIPPQEMSFILHIKEDFAKIMQESGLEFKVQGWGIYSQPMNIQNFH